MRGPGFGVAHSFCRSGADRVGELTWPAFWGSVWRMKTSRPTIMTGAGDRGTTRAAAGEIVSKASPSMCALGDLDELNALLGVARAHLAGSPSAERIRRAQEWILTASAEVALPPGQAARLTRRIGPDAVAEIERWGMELTDGAEPSRGFRLPGSTIREATIDHARAVARRCERSLVGLAQGGSVKNESLIAWLNRLSDWLWLLAGAEAGE